MCQRRKFATSVARGTRKSKSFRAFESAQLQLRVASKNTKYKTVATSILPISAAGLGFSSTKSSAPRGWRSTLFKWIEKSGAPRTCLRHVFRGRKKNLSLIRVWAAASSQIWGSIYIVIIAVIAMNMITIHPSTDHQTHPHSSSCPQLSEGRDGGGGKQPEEILVAE